uniref:Nucleolar pre-ribosomal-associated protein 1 n=1 Tax=Magallana gigas TaxID=29159 RepID=K1PPI3_MAGGI
MQEKILPGKKRKKKLNKQGNSSPNKKKKTDDDNYTEIRFKFELRDANLTFLALEKFVNQAKECNPESKGYDIVAGYCRSSPECSEILQLLDGGKRNETEIHRIFGALEVILLRIVDDLSKHAPVGKVILQKILSVGMPSVYYLLGPRVRASAVKTTLRLLGALVLLGESGAKALLSQLDTTHKHVQLLFTRRDPKDSQDVRTCLVQFIMAFLMVGSNSVIQQLINIKGFLSTLFNGLIQDKAADVKLVLNTVLEKVVENETVTKTQRLRLFNDYSLAQISRLYNWTGQVEEGGDNAEEEKGENDTPLKENKDEIAELANKLLMELCCSHTHGVNFYDRTLGTGGKNQNQLLTNFLTTVSKTVDGKAVQNLICQILRNCPDQIRHYLPCLIKNIAPRPTTRWCSTMNFLCEIYKHQPDRPMVLKSTQHHSSVKFVDMVMVHLIPIPQILSSVLQSLKHTHPTVRYLGMKFLGVLLQKSVTFLHCLSQECEKPSTSVYSKAEMEEILQLFKENVLKIFPDCKLIMSCWRELLFAKKTTNQKTSPVKSGTETDGTEETVKEDVPEVLVTEHMVEIEKALCLLQELSPSILLDNSGDVNLLLEGVRKMSEVEKTGGENENEAMETDDGSHDKQTELLPQLYLLKLLSETDARKLPWTQQSQDGHSLMYLMLEMLSKMSDPDMLKSLEHLLVQLLHSTGLFEGHIREVELWMTHFTKSSDKLVLIKPLSDTFTTYISNSMSYVDRLCIHMSKVASAETDDTIMDDVAMETGSVNTGDSAINAILEMDEEDFEDISDENETEVATGLREVELWMTHFTKSSDKLVLIKPLSDTFTTYISNSMSYVDRLCIHMSKVASAETDDTIMDDVAMETGSVNTGDSAINARYAFIHRVCIVLLAILEMDEEDFKDISDENETEVETGLRLPFTPLMIVAMETSNKIKEANENSEEISTVFCWYLSGILIDILHHQVEPIIITTLFKNLHGNMISTDVLQYMESLLQPQKKEKKKTMKTKIDTKKLYFTASHVSVELISVLQSKETSQENEDTVRNGLNSVSLYELDSLVDQILLYCGVLLKFQRAEDKDLLKFYWKILKTVVAMVTDDTAESGQDAMDSTDQQLTSDLNVKFIEPPKWSREDCLREILQNILSHPAVLDHFLFPSRDVTLNKPSGFCEDLGVCLTEGLCSILVEVKSSPEESVSRSLDGYFDNLLALLDIVSIEQACLQVLACYPLATVAMPKSVFIQCLESDSAVRMEILSIVICQNVQARDWFESWIVEKKLADFKSCGLQLVLQYIDRCPERLAGSKKVLLKILKIYKHCLNLLEKEKEVSLEGKEGSEISTWKPTTPFESMINLSLSLHQMKVLDADLEDMVISLITKLMAEPTNLSHQHIEVLAGFCGNPENTGRRSLLLKTCQSCLMITLKNKQMREAGWVDPVIGVMDEMKELYDIEMIKKWPDFAKMMLRYKYTNKLTLQLLATMADCVYHVNMETDPSSSSELPLQQLHEMLISHSQYLPIMFNESHPEVKEALVDFMTVLVGTDPNCCQTQHIGVLLGAYSASLSSTDQKILKLLFLYENNKADLKAYRPILWGMKAVETHSVKKSLGAILSKQTTSEEVMECLDQKTMENSILKIPLRRQMQPGVIQVATNIKSVPEAYDPCFLLPVLSDLVKSDSVLDCRKFVENQCLSFTLACLSCHDGVMRGAAYHVLANFLSQLQGARFQEVKQVLYFVEIVRNSIEKPNIKLPCIITLFLSRVATELLKPEEHMYRMLNAFMLLKPAMDTGNVPEFYTFFNSSAVEYKIERAWMLSLLSDGLRETADFHVFEKRHVLKMLLSFYESSISDNSTQLQVLHILRAASKERKVTSDLVRNHGIVAWFSVMLQSNKEIKLESYCQLLENFNSVLEHADFSRVKGQDEGHRFPKDRWTIRDAMLLLGNIGVYGDDPENLQCVTSVLKALKLDTMSLVESNIVSSTSGKLLNKKSKTLDSLSTQWDSEEMKKVIEQTLKLLIRWDPSYLLSTQSAETTTPLSTGVIIVSLWFLKQSRNVISRHFWEIFVDWLHSALMSSDVLMKVLLDCPKESQIVLEGLIGLYSHLNNCILEEHKSTAAVQEQITLADRGSFTTDSWNGVVKKLNEVVYCMSQQKIYAEEQKWKQFSIRYKKITDPENQSVALRQYMLEHLTETL